MKPQQGEPFTIPAGTPVHSMGTGRWHESKRKQTVWPFHVDEYDGWTVVTWPGQGGYWRRVVIRNEQFFSCFPGLGDPTWESLKSA